MHRDGITASEKREILYYHLPHILFLRIIQHPPPAHHAAPLDGRNIGSSVCHHLVSSDLFTLLSALASNSSFVFWCAMVIDCKDHNTPSLQLTQQRELI